MTDAVDLNGQTKVLVALCSVPRPLVCIHIIYAPRLGADAARKPIALCLFNMP